MIADVQHWVAHYGNLAIFLLLCFGIIGVPVPDETMLIFAGYLASRGTLSLWQTLAVAFAGTTLGITSSYFLGLYFGRWLIDRHGKRLHLDRERADKVERWFERIGKWTLTFGYFIPGVRHLTALTAGTTKMPFRLFALYAYPGGLFWSCGFILTGFFLGEKWKESSQHVRHMAMIGAAGIVAAALIVYGVTRMVRRQRRTATGEEKAAAS